MSIRKSSFACLPLYALCLAGALAAAAHAEPVTLAAGGGVPMTSLHGIGEVGGKAIAAAMTVAPQAPAAGPVVADADAEPVYGGPATFMPMTAAERAQDSAAVTTICDGYFSQSEALAPAVGPATKAVMSRDLVSLGAQLANLSTLLDGLPAQEIRAEVCNANHINAYTSYQYFEIATLRAHGIDSGLPANLPLVKQPDLNQGGLAFIVGWAKYEQKDFAGAAAAYSKGLAMFPHAHGLQAEYAATLLSLQQGAQAVSFIDGVLQGTGDLNDDERGTFYEQRAVGLVLVHALDAADQNFTISLRYHYSEEVKNLQEQLRQARAQMAGQAPAAPAQK